MKMASWNLRGFASALKKKGVQKLVRSHDLDLIALLETKTSPQRLEEFIFYYLPGWKEVNNFSLAPNSRIVVLWNPQKIDLEVLTYHGQVIHCAIKCLTEGWSFNLSAVYGASTIVKRKDLWCSLLDFHEAHTPEWLLMGDFNNVLAEEEKANGVQVTAYEIDNFAACCQTIGLTDCPSVGCFYTWTNNRVFSKLDRCMSRNFFDIAGVNVQANFLPSGCISDHSPCVVSLFDTPPQKHCSFRFQNMWTHHPEFLQLIMQNWSSEKIGTAQYNFCAKLKSMKPVLRELNKNHYMHITERAKRSLKALEAAQQELDKNPLNVMLQSEVKKLKQASFFHSSAELHFYKQRAKAEYLQLSDRCTNFFHTMARQKAKKNYIASVTSDTGIQSSSLETVGNFFVSYYSKLLGSEEANPQHNEVSTTMGSEENILELRKQVFDMGPKFTQVDADLLRIQVTRNEIKRAMFSIGDNKAAGPDGFSSMFFKHSWDLTGDAVCSAVEEFFHYGRLLKQINHTAIALIPKSAHAQRVEDYRPISCCNTVYKVISKLLASKLAPALDGVIDKAQSAFVPGRLMSDNVFLLQELLKGYSRARISPRCIIKIDLRKAFDSVRWDFLHQALVGLNFPSDFIGLIMECVTTTSFSVVVNGALNGFFKGRRGLRQGDPLSPYLFVICIEYLSRLIKEKTQDSEFNYHPKCAKLKITHLAFADDLMLLARADETSIQILMDCLKEFGDVSGLKMNIIKSNIYIAGIQNSDRRKIEDETHLIEGTLPVRYLGIPLAAAKLRAIDYNPLVANIAEKIASWARLKLSYAGRLELIKSVLQGIESFWLSIFNIPNIVKEKIIRMCRIFLWGFNYPPISWATVCLPKSEGGLGVRDLNAWNKALISKVIWNVHAKKDTLWIAWITDQFSRRGQIWDWIPKHGDSAFVRYIIDIKQSITAAHADVEVCKKMLGRWYSSGRNSSEAYDFFREKKSGQPWANIIWNSYVLPKHAFITWIAAHQRLPVGNRLRNNNEAEVRCTFCSAPETQTHLFFDCRFTNAVWSKIKNWLSMKKNMSTIQSALKWLKKEKTSSSWIKRARRVAFTCTVHSLWRIRNASRKENHCQTMEAAVHSIKTIVCRQIEEVKLINSYCPTLQDACNSDNHECATSDAACNSFHI